MSRWCKKYRVTKALRELLFPHGARTARALPSALMKLVVRPAALFSVLSCPLFLGSCTPVNSGVSPAGEVSWAQPVAVVSISAVARQADKKVLDLKAGLELKGKVKEVNAMVISLSRTTLSRETGLGVGNQ